MTDVTFEDVLKFAEQLTPEEQEELIVRLRTQPITQKRPSLQFPVDDLGTWDDTFSLRREDWYDDQR